MKRQYVAIGFIGFCAGATLGLTPMMGIWGPPVAFHGGAGPAVFLLPLLGGLLGAGIGVAGWMMFSEFGVWWKEWKRKKGKL